jgi:Zn-dependent protease
MWSRLTFTAGRFSGVPVRVGPGAVLLVVLLAVTLASQVLPVAAPGSTPAAYWSVGVLGAAVFAASLLAHELAHCAAALRAKVAVSEVRVGFIGGATVLASTPRSASAELRIAIAGPAASAALAVLFTASALPLGDPRASVPAALFAWSAAMNVVLAAFNMLPFLPLDGGRVLAALLWSRSGQRWTSKVTAARVGVVAGAGVCVLAATPAVLSAQLSSPTVWLGAVGLFVLAASTFELVSYRVAAAVEGMSVPDVMAPPDPAGAVSAEVISSDDDLSEVVVASSADRVVVVDPVSGERVGVVDLAALRAEALGRS